MKNKFIGKLIIIFITKMENQESFIYLFYFFVYIIVHKVNVKYWGCIWIVEY